MNKQDVLVKFEQAYQQGLMKPETISEDLADKYVAWLQGKIAEATSQMQPEPAPANTGAETQQPEETENGK